MQKYIYYCLIALFLAGCTGAPTARGAATAQPDRVETKAPAQNASADETKSSAPAEKAPAETTKSSAPDDEVLNYLEEIALSGFEFGSAPEVAYKWTHDIDISVSGDLTEADRGAIAQTIKDLNELIAPRQVNLVQAGGDITIWYGPSKEFSKRLPSYTPGNLGYFSIRYGGDYSIRSATILIASEIEIDARAHLVREELTQSLGFFQDSRQDPLSIFQQDWTMTQTYSELDRAIIPLLYDERVKPGMSAERVLAIFS